MAKNRTTMQPINRKALKPLVNVSEIARRMGVSANYVHMLMNGERTSKRRLKQIDRILLKNLAGNRNA